MTETEWLRASKPYTFFALFAVDGGVGKHGRLMVGLLEPLQEAFSEEEEKNAFRVFREWAEGERANIEPGILRDLQSLCSGDMDCTAAELGRAALLWAVHYGPILTTNGSDCNWEANHPELMLKSARAQVIRKVGRMPQRVPLTHPIHLQWSQAYNAEYQAVQAQQAQLMRCVFGNPFRKIHVESAWRSGTAVALAQAIHDDRAFERLPILADALEEVGCSNEAVLAHCRGAGPHVRGCWVVDLLLGKE